MLNRILFILVCLFAGHLTFSSSPESKELYKQARNYLYSNPDSAKILANQLYAKSIKKEDAYGLVRSQYLLGWMAQFQEGNYGKALIHYLEGVRFGEFGEYASRDKDIHGIYLNLGNIYEAFGDNENASLYINKSVELASHLNDKKLLMASLRKLYGHYFETTDFQNALTGIEQYQIINGEVGDKEMELHSYNEKGLVYKELREYQKALEQFENVIEATDRYGIDGHRTIKAMALTNKAEVLLHMGSYEKSREFCLMSLDEKDKIEDYQKLNPRSYFLSLKGLADVDMVFNSFDSAEKSIKTAYSFMNEIGDINEEIYFSFINSIADYYESQMHYRRANEYRKVHASTLEEYWDQQRQIELLDKKYNLELITQRYYGLRKQQERNEQIELYSMIGIVGLLVLFSAILANGYYQRYRVKRELEESIRMIQES